MWCMQSTGCLSPKNHVRSHQIQIVLCLLGLQYLFLDELEWLYLFLPVWQSKITSRLLSTLKRAKEFFSVALCRCYPLQIFYFIRRTNKFNYFIFVLSLPLLTVWSKSTWPSSAKAAVALHELGFGLNSQVPLLS